MSDLTEDLPVGSVGVDVGAEPDKDDWTGRMLDRVGANGRVYAFEPDPDKFARLQALYGDRPNAVLEMKAAADCDGPVTLCRSGSHYSLAYSGGHEIQPEGVSLDSYFADRPRVDYLKIDTEGGEYRILQGCRKLIAANPNIRIHLELHLGVLSRADVTASMMLSLLDELGLQPGLRYGEPMNAEAFSTIGDGHGVVLWVKNPGEAMRVCDCCNERRTEVSFNRVVLTEDYSTKEDRQVANYPQGIDLCYGCYSVLYDKIQQAVAEATGNKQ